MLSFSFNFATVPETLSQIGKSNLIAEVEKQLQSHSSKYAKECLKLLQKQDKQVSLCLVNKQRSDLFS